MLSSLQISLKHQCNCHWLSKLGTNWKTWKTWIAVACVMIIICVHVFMRVYTVNTPVYVQSRRSQRHTSGCLPVRGGRGVELVCCLLCLNVTIVSCGSFCSSLCLFIESYLSDNSYTDIPGCIELSLKMPLLLVDFCQGLLFPVIWQRLTAPLNVTCSIPLKCCIVHQLRTGLK